MNKLIRARAAKWARKLIANRHTVRNWTHENAQDYLEQAYQAGARSMDRWHRQRVRVSDIVDVTVGPLSSAGGVLERDGLLVVPALSAEADAILDGRHTGVSVGYREPRPRPKVGQNVRLLVVRECFQLVGLRVGSIGEVTEDNGGLLTVTWPVVGHMWIDEADVAVVGEGIWA